MEAKFGRNFILWMMEEMGKCIAIIKKKGDSAIMREASVREAFVEEMSDVSMYYFENIASIWCNSLKKSQMHMPPNTIKIWAEIIKGNTITI